MRENFTKAVDEIKDRPTSPAMPSEHSELESWRVFKILAEFVEGFELLEKYGLAATFFGSARCNLGDKFYHEAEHFAAGLSQQGYAIITGGGPGIMEAANKGAKEAGGDSIGLSIELPEEQGQNAFLTDSASFHYFFVRKVMLSFASEVYVFFPGGYGTLDEVFEMLTLIQTKKVQNIPIILYGREFWEPLIEWMRTSLLEDYKTISPEDLEIFHIVDSVEEGVETVLRTVKGPHRHHEH